MYSAETKDFLLKLGKKGEELLSISHGNVTSINRKQVETVKKTIIDPSNKNHRISSAFMEKELSIDVNTHNKPNNETEQIEPNKEDIQDNVVLEQTCAVEDSNIEPEEEYDIIHDIEDFCPTTSDNVDAYLKSETVFPKEDYPFEYRTFVEVVNRYLLQFSKSTRARFIPSEEQLRVIYSMSRRLLIESGAGTGKTTIIIIKMFLEQNMLKLTNDDILAITYTKEGASSMLRRYDKIRSEFSSTRFLEFKTIHSYCLGLCSAFKDELKIITETNDAITYEWDEIESQYIEKKVKLLDIIAEGTQQLALKKFVSPKSVLSAINTIMEMCITNEQEFRNLEVYTDFALTYTQIMFIYDYYNKKKKELEVYDYLDMLVEANNIFTKILNGELTNLSVLQEKAYTFKSIYVDEVQDISPLQAIIIDKLLKLNPDARLTVIGDTDQSIYSFRGASVDYIMGFPKKYAKDPTLDIIYLTRNRRSAPNIISLSDKFIRNNKCRFPKKLRGLDNDTRVGNISFYEDTVGFLHKNIILDVINRTKNKNIADLGKYAVLYREHKQCTWLINYLVCNRIPFNINLEYYSEEFVINSKEFKDLIFLSHLIRQPNNPDLVKGYLFKLVAAITKTQAEKISFEMRSNPCAKLLPFVKKYGTEKDVTDIINLRKLLLDNVQPAIFFKALIQKYQESYYTSYIISQHRQNKMPDIIDYFEYKKNLDLIQNEIDSDKRWIKLNTHVKASITLNTFHISKGLEYENVFILPLSDDISPKFQRIAKTMSERGISKYIEEERRLLYVAITRAKSNLCIFYTPNKQINLQKQIEISKTNTVSDKIAQLSNTEKGMFATELLQAYEKVLEEYPTMTRQIYQMDNKG